MKAKNFTLNKIYLGNCLEIMEKLPSNSVDLIFADPPYNLQLEKKLTRPDSSDVNGVDNNWDKFKNFQEYDDFTKKWIICAKRVLKENGTIWVIGTYHNIFRIGKTLQDLNFWILNDVVWVKSNPMPNFRGTRFSNAHETLIWCSKNKNSKYTFNYNLLKSLNDDLQMRSDWIFPICNGSERLKYKGKKVHPTQKPESLITRIILSATNPEDVILDPFFGTGTIGAVSKKYNRNFIGIEKEKNYVKFAKKRIGMVKPLKNLKMLEISEKRQQKRIPFGRLIEFNLIKPGDVLHDFKKKWHAKVRIDGSLIAENFKGSIHTVAANLLNLPSCNGWTFWYKYENKNSVSIDILREKVRSELNLI
ncbi:MAG: Modification methylase DpnIIB [Alphaproteobacteria bacterium MarineAlpha6_Bin4]|nr:MAG: Modification methylase DpnIIB [Alphaproteobacteria bacterium MarineAlpha6_Bin3]PPR38096.1 MAG: Modification methylase DpnIIB [Alphaproteobacteria bacterium MarineAlpha6_Bin4]|tara:strand:+ start:26436 stop:27521 length:1086 start_codon:yes stop_codon:yes gene_type:complete